jgi:hypothetical protein
MGAEVLIRVARGETGAVIAKALGTSELVLNEWLDDPARGETVRRARRAGAAAMAEQTLAIAEGELPTVHPVTGELIVDPARDKLRIQTRQWVAERRDRATWGTVKDGVTINIAGLHLDALRARPTPVEAVDVSYIEGSSESGANDIEDGYAEHPLFG